MLDAVEAEDVAVDRKGTRSLLETTRNARRELDSNRAVGPKDGTHKGLTPSDSHLVGPDDNR